MELLALALLALGSLPVIWLGLRRWRQPRVRVRVDGFPPGLDASAGPGSGTGDDEFDRLVALSGDQARWLLLARPEVRVTLQAAIGLGLELRGGVMSGWVPPAHAARIEAAVSSMREALAEPLPLFERYRGEGDAGVRLRLMAFSERSGMDLAARVEASRTLAGSEVPSWFESLGWRWDPASSKASGALADRAATCWVGGGSLTARCPIPPAARLVAHPAADGSWKVEVKPTATGMSFASSELHALLRRTPPCQSIHAEDGELRIRFDPADLEALQRGLAFLEALASLLESLASRPDAERITLAFRSWGSAPGRATLARDAFAHDRELAAEHLLDPDLEVRRLAARFAPHPPTLVALLADPAVAQGVRSVALDDLGASDDPRALAAGVAHALGEPLLAARALALVQRHELTELWPNVAALVNELAPEAGPVRNLGLDLVRRALLVLVALEQPETERLLVRSLSVPDAQVRLALVAALGRMGGSEAALALVALAKQVPGEAVAVRQALSEMRRRHGAGGLTLTELSGGELSDPSAVPENLAGAVSEAPAPDLTDRG